LQKAIGKLAVTIWDRSVFPPKAWKAEDGDLVPVRDEVILQCSICLRFFESDPLKKTEFCSPGCRIRFAENRARVNDVDVKNASDDQ